MSLEQPCVGVGKSRFSVGSPFCECKRAFCIAWRADWIYPGEVLLILSYGYYPPSTWYGRCSYSRSCYIVRRGDTLLGIAHRYGVDVWALARVNGIYNLNRIYTGMPLVIPR